MKGKDASAFNTSSEPHGLKKFHIIYITFNMLSTFAFVCLDVCKIQNARLLLMLQLVYFSMALSSFQGYR